MSDFISDIFTDDLLKRIKINVIEIKINLEDILDLKEIYGKIMVSNNLIQLASYHNDIKYCNELPYHNQLKLRSYKRFGKIIPGLGIHFDDMNFTIFKKIIKISYNPNCNKIDEYSNIIFGLCNCEIRSYEINNVTFTIKFLKNDDNYIKDQLISSGIVFEKPPNTRKKYTQKDFPFEYSNRLVFDNCLEFVIVKNIINGTSNSINILNEFVKYINNYVKIINDDVDILNDDNVHLQIII